jgi:hypothetical protein
MRSRRTFLTAAAAAGTSVLSGNAIAGKDLEGIKFGDNHAGFGYVGPQDVNLLDHWRSAGVNYLSVNVAYDAVPWSTTIRAIAEFPEESRRGRTWFCVPPSRKFSRPGVRASWH